MTTQIEKRLRVLEAAAQPKQERGGSRVVLEMPDGRWFAAGAFHATKEIACSAGIGAMVCIIGKAPITRGGVLTTFMEMDAGDLALSDEIFR